MLRVCAQVAHVNMCTSRSNAATHCASYRQLLSDARVHDVQRMAVSGRSPRSWSWIFRVRLEARSCGRY